VRDIILLDERQPRLMCSEVKQNFNRRGENYRPEYKIFLKFNPNGDKDWYILRLLS
jgi:hypothetical protein